MGELLWRKYNSKVSLEIQRFERELRVRVLFITSQFPYPLDNGGKIGAINGLDILRDDDVTFLSFCEQPQVIQEGTDFLSKRFPKLRIIKPIVHDIHIQKKPLKLINTIIKSYFGKYPYLVAKFWDKAMFHMIDEVFHNNYFDIIFIDYLNMQCYGSYIKEKYSDKFNLYILKDHNIEYEITKQMAENASFLKKVLLIPIWKKTKKFEIDSIRNADIVLSVCDENAAYFRSFNHNSYAMRPAFDINTKAQNNEIKDNLRLLYIGNLSWKPNMEGLAWFIEKVYPIIKKKKSEITLDIIGSGAEKNPFYNIQGIKWHGFVSDISAVYQNYAVFIVPLWAGSGIRIKILEAFNNDIAVVSTSIGCNTIGAIDGIHLLIADDEATFANAVLRLLDDVALRKKLCIKAKKFFKENYSIESRITEFKEIINLVKGGNNNGDGKNK